MKEYVLKTIFLGDAGVGKSSILAKKKLNVFDPDCKSTIGIDFVVIEKSINGVNVKLQIWDSAGQEKYGNIVQSYYREIAGAFLVYDVNIKKTYDNLNLWIDRIKFFSPDCEIVIVGNKIDMNQPIIQEKYIDVPHHLLCSAKSGAGIDEMFDIMMEIFVKKIQHPSFIKNSHSGITIYEEFNFSDECHEVFPKRRKKDTACCQIL